MKCNQKRIKFQGFYLLQKLLRKSNFFFLLLFLWSFNAFGQCRCVDSLVFLPKDTIRYKNQKEIEEDNEYMYQVGLKRARLTALERISKAEKLVRADSSESNVNYLVPILELVQKGFPENSLDYGYVGISIKNREQVLATLKRWKEQIKTKGLYKERKKRTPFVSVFYIGYEEIRHPYELGYRNKFYSGLGGVCNWTDRFDCLFRCEGKPDISKLLHLLKTDLDTLAGIKTMPVEEMTKENIESVLALWRAELCE